jgi:DNA-binding NarL/FixJ family response regulator
VKASRAKDLSVLLAVEPPSFQRLIEHVLFGEPGLRVMGNQAKAVPTTRQSPNQSPNVIIVRTRIKGKEHGAVLADLKRSSPAATLILLTHGLYGSASPQGADTWLAEDAVVRQLLPVLRRVARRVRDRVSQPASAGTRT